MFELHSKRRKFNVHKHTKKANVTNRRSQRGGGGGVLFHALVKFPLVEIWSIFYYLDVSPEIYFRKSDRYDRDLSFLTDKKLCDRTDLHQSAFGVTVITLVAITGVVCLFTSQRYTQVIFELRSKSWKRTYADFEILLVVNADQIQGLDKQM